MPGPIAELRAVDKVYRLGEVHVAALRGVSFRVEAGDFVAILGRSGSGKSTLLSILGCLDEPTAGEVYIQGQRVSGLLEPEVARIRNRAIGFVFQSFHLLPYYDAVSNVELPLLYAGAADAARKAEALLRQVGLGERLRHLPSQLSGGQRQRVAVARAIANDPGLILADEPTGNLDAESGEQVMRLFGELHRAGRTIVVVTHDRQIAASARRIVEVADGRIVSDRRASSGSL